MPVPSISHIVVPIDISEPLEWGTSSIIIGLACSSHSTGSWLSTIPPDISEDLSSDLPPSICSRSVSWTFWPCCIPIMASPHDGTSPVEGSLFHSFNVPVPGSISLGIIKLRGRPKDSDDLLDDIQG